MRRRRHCIRKKTVTRIQDYGPAKRVRVCAAYGSGRKGAGVRYCVFKGKRKNAPKHSCHTNKRAAKHAAAMLRKTCRAKVRVRRVRAA